MMYQGKYRHAQELHEKALTYHRSQGFQDGIAGALGNLGDVLRYRAIILQRNVACWKAWPSLQHSSSFEAFALAWQHGQQLTLESTIAYALSEAIN